MSPVTPVPDPVEDRNFLKPKEMRRTLRQQRVERAMWPAAKLDQAAPSRLFLFCHWELLILKITLTRVSSRRLERACGTSDSSWNPLYMILGLCHRSLESFTLVFVAHQSFFQSSDPSSPHTSHSLTVRYRSRSVWISKKTCIFSLLAASSMGSPGRRVFFSCYTKVYGETSFGLDGELTSWKVLQGHAFTNTKFAMGNRSVLLVVLDWKMNLDFQIASYLGSD